jgi:GDP/UDP-N,N'-diacetylbacillosamine 2-epimerase (hydrolysing)
MKRKILAFTGIRSEYDILYPVLKKFHCSDDFELSVVVSGAHLSQRHGMTSSLIEQDGFRIAERVDSLVDTDRLTQRPHAVARLIAGFSQTVEREKPDILMVVGDREESIAVTIVGNYMNILTAHIGGGDPVYGNADDPIRFAASKLAHIHFTTAKPYSDHLRNIGEDDWRICFCGTPGLDNIVAEPEIPLPEIQSYLGQDLRHFIVLLKHPLSSEYYDARYQMKTSLEAVGSFARRHDYTVVGIYPNTDPGSQEMVQEIEEFECDKIKFHKTLPRRIFINLMRRARVLVGNSSMGILEAPMYGLPVVNIGNRQTGRLNAGNVEFVPYDSETICQALEKAALNENYRHKVKALENPYGDGHAAERIAQFLSQTSIDDHWLTKRKLVP